MSQKIGKISPGDSIVVDGWGPNVFRFKSPKIEGFISYGAVGLDKRYDPIIKKIQTESLLRVKEKQRADSTESSKWNELLALEESNSILKNKKRRADSLELKNAQMVFLRLSTSKKEVMVGECTVINLSLFISVMNNQPLQWFDLGPQITEITHKQFPKENCWVSDNRIENIVGKEEKISNKAYVSFNLYSASYCPIEQKDIVFPIVSLKMEEKQTVPNLNSISTKFVSFNTSPLTIKVKPKPIGLTASSSDFYDLVGKFKISEKFLNTNAQSKHPLTYSLTLQGIGLTYPIPAPKLLGKNCSTKFLDKIHSDTIIQDVYLSQVTYNYEILSSNQGADNDVDLSNQILFTAIDPENGTSYSLKSKARISAKNLAIAESNKIKNENLDNYILLDISQSMMIEDYEPNRLEFLKNGLKEFLMNRNCDFRLVLFAGDVLDYSTPNGDSCYTTPSIRMIDFSLIKERGTAIGDAIWQTIQTKRYLSKAKPKKLIVISDGDITAGMVSATSAIKLANKYKIKIYTVGIGHSGEVKLGKDQNGNPNIVINTFSDKDLKRLALQTGGKYYWVETRQGLLNALKEISQVP